MTTFYTHEEVSSHNGENGAAIWAIIDSYVLDLTAFIQHHPGSAKKIINRRNKSIDISSNFLDHFGHTVRSFREACRKYDRREEVVVLTFPEAKGEVHIIGKVKR